MGTGPHRAKLPESVRPRDGSTLDERAEAVEHTTVVRRVSYGLVTRSRGVLDEILERCDRVKFAGYRPDADESLATLAAARGFVEDTRLQVAA